MIIIGIDPGKFGGIVSVDEMSRIIHLEKMPLDKDEFVCKDSVRSIIESMKKYDSSYILCERAIPMAQGVKAAFNYGYDFSTICGVIKEFGSGYGFIEPSKWTKLLHAGINKNYLPKEKSRIVFSDIFAKDLARIPVGPRSGKIHEGIMDAALIAHYGVKTIINTSQEP